LNITDRPVPRLLSGRKSDLHLCTVEVAFHGVFQCNNFQSLHKKQNNQNHKLRVGYDHTRGFNVESLLCEVLMIVEVLGFSQLTPVDSLEIFVNCIADCLDNNLPIKVFISGLSDFV
jgi:hypothetical protein